MCIFFFFKKLFFVEINVCLSFFFLFYFIFVLFFAAEVRNNDF
ncbi:hypothetical protein DDB_G0286783 [Dictyostelium discoideum AX4]|uniref:Uncharacterized transmembrane protein DDB_G0286783 n=1 Tax=Dictyostelium discoideum TaxID=44689 RepID=Y5632_DICDI|nr:hypothetical protein DDB_G0286783 [Dictyostelium discoideum AX4]Q54LA2.1 RecName: Full=Uncharacterized transmembrane protein DDB_G0286783 [Dictyostelium discoideum]EAL64147.1 hypothetical protein DDB_G0286783 [Dictyostelium discoideum AX4]|eukprot:XP_637659.1 hypothetical protein DDB_G0286783 [Dictyostelium discoideum AX4]